MELESIRRWITNSQSRIKRNGWRGAVGAAKPVYIKALQQTMSYTSGESIFAHDWDLLIILDACRFDLLSEVANANEYAFIENMSAFPSLDSATKPWMARTFTTDYLPEMEQTAYVCGNPFSASELDTADFALLDEVWKYGWDDELGTLPPRPITDRTIAASRNDDAERIIAHYMQPHCPFVGSGNSKQKKSLAKWGRESSPDIWQRLADGNVESAQVWKDYRANLQYVLDEVELLLSNIDAERVVISSDHGNAIGEWGLYGHPAHMPFQCLRTVPWISTTARDMNTHTPTTERKQSAVSNEEMEVSERLEALGYR